MLITKQNRLLPILAVVVLLMLTLVLSKSCVDEDAGNMLLDTIPTASAPDADTPADTIKTLTANVAAMTAELKTLRKDNDDLRSDNQKLLSGRDQLEQRLSNRIEDEFSVLEQQQKEIDEIGLSSLSDRLDALSAALIASNTDTAISNIPIGLGLEPDYASSELVWIEPLDSGVSEISGEVLQKAGHLSNVMSRDASTARGTGVDYSSDAADLPKPVYTVPRNATLMGATAMTALLGRVPVRGEVRDPMPFKVITGRDNLAANGLTVPGVEGMIWSGTAIGDWTLACVTGRLESVTYVFDDGSIRTISTDDRENQTGEANRPLGWISDARGIPCLSGERKSNAAAFLSQRIGVKAIEAASDAAAASQTTSLLRDSGTIAGNVSGNTGKFVLGKTLAGGSNEIAQWLLERQAQSFDAVFVPAGAEIAIHVDRQLSIDLDPQGRRLKYASSNTNPIAHRLD